MYQIERRAVVSLDCAERTCGWSSGWMVRWRCAMANAICPSRTLPWSRPKSDGITPDQSRQAETSTRPKPGQRMGKEFRSAESAENLAGGARVGCRRAEEPRHDSSHRGKWREGKVRPLQGNSPHDRPVSRGFLSFKESLRRSLLRHSFPRFQEPYRAPRYAFFKAWRNLSVRCGLQKTKPRAGTLTASRRSAPAPGKRTRREDRALLIVRDEFRPAIPRSGWSPPEPVSASPAHAD